MWLFNYTLPFFQAQNIKMSGVQGIGIAAKNQEGSKQVYILPSHNKKYGHRNLLEGHCSCVFQFKCLQLFKILLSTWQYNKGKGGYSLSSTEDRKTCKQEVKWDVVSDFKTWGEWRQCLPLWWIMRSYTWVMCAFTPCTRAPGWVKLQPSCFVIASLVKIPRTVKSRDV